MTRSAALDAALAAFGAELTRWGARMNLVGSTEPPAIARHVEDSLAAAEHLPEGVSVVDLGSGAGFPGIPLALARPDLRLTLVEIREKRLAFLRYIARELAPSLEIVAGSIESPYRRDFDFALLRAVAKTERSLELGLPWVRATGEVWIWSGPSAKSSARESIPLGSGGSILRFHAADISRGTA